MPVGIVVRLACQGQNCALMLDIGVMGGMTMPVPNRIQFDFTAMPQGWTMDHRGVFCPAHQPRMVEAAPYIPPEILRSVK